MLWIMTISKRVQEAAGRFICPSAYGTWRPVININVRTPAVGALIAVCVAIALVTGRPAQADPLRVFVLGDSLTAGYGLSFEEAFPAQLERRLNAEGIDGAILNAGVSGDTTAGGLARLGWILADQPSHVILALGANDGLRGLDPAAMHQNLNQIVERLQAENIPVLLAGMYAPPNFGLEYGAAFKAVFQTIAQDYGIPLYPFFLEGVAADPDLNQPDGLHPTAEGVAVMVDSIYPLVRAWLSE